MSYGVGRNLPHTSILFINILTPTKITPHLAVKHNIYNSKTVQTKVMSQAYLLKNTIAVRIFHIKKTTSI